MSNYWNWFERTERASLHPSLPPLRWVLHERRLQAPWATPILPLFLKVPPSRYGVVLVLLEVTAVVAALADSSALDEVLPVSYALTRLEIRDRMLAPRTRGSRC